MGGSSCERRGTGHTPANRNRITCQEPLDGRVWPPAVRRESVSLRVPPGAKRALHAWCSIVLSGAVTNGVSVDRKIGQGRRGGQATRGLLVAGHIRRADGGNWPCNGRAFTL